MSKKKRKAEESVVEAVSEVESVKSARAVLTLDNGTEYEVTNCDGKYYHCGGVKFRKSNPHIVSVRT